MNNDTIIQKAAELIKAVNDSGRSILDENIAERFGSLNIYIFDNKVHVDGYPGEGEKYTVEGTLDFKVW